MSSATQVANLDKVVEEFGVVFKNKGLSVPALSAETVLDGSLGLESLDFAELVMRLELKDRRAGFPTRFLDAPSDEGVELKVEDGELHVRSANAMIGTGSTAGIGSREADWLPTGDLIEQVGDRYFFTGRRNDVINVGGNKVQPLRVEHIIQVVPGVRDVRVFSRSSSLVGQMVACEFVPEPGFEPEDVRQAILKICLEQLDGHERPRFVQAVPIIALSDAEKKIRKP